MSAVSPAATALRGVAERNRHAFGTTAVVTQITSLQGWTDLGEREALASVASQVRGAPMLDVGVGVGRTAPFGQLLTDDYVAVDFSPDMVRACTDAHPGVDVRVGDARDLSDFADASFGFVMFSFNGLDAVGHDDRPRALREMIRVLRPGGILLYSTLNKDGRSFGEVPWQLHRRDENLRFSPRRAASFALHVPEKATRTKRALRNYREHRAQIETHDDWAIGPLAAHEFCLAVHFITLGGLRRELNELDVDLVRIFASSGQIIEPSNEHSGADYFHVIVQRRKSQPGGQQ
jgi:SAM-dependent methyltransferase